MLLMRWVHVSHAQIAFAPFSVVDRLKSGYEKGFYNMQNKLNDAITRTMATRNMAAAGSRK